MLSNSLDVVRFAERTTNRGQAPAGTAGELMILCAYVIQPRFSETSSGIQSTCRAGTAAS